MFKNLTLYRLSGSCLITEVQERAEALAFSPCGPTQAQSYGFESPRGIKHGAMVETVVGQFLLRVRIQRKAIPSAEIRKWVTERAEFIERETGRKPGRKAMKEMKEEAVLALLPHAFAKDSFVLVWIDPAVNLVALDTASSAAAETVVSLLAKVLGNGVSLRPVQTNTTPAALMSAWLAVGDTRFPAFSLGREAELKAPDELRASVRYVRHSLDISEVSGHVLAGKVATKLALNWAGRADFVLTDSLTVRKLELDSVVFESGRSDAPEEAFDADAAIFTGELRPMLADLIAALGGELVLEGGAA